VASITLEDAERVLERAKTRALDMGLKVSISIVDPRGDLICMVRIDEAPWRTPAVSRGKARASACFGVPSAQLTDRAATPVLQAVMLMEGGHLVPGQGALPIVQDGELIGAIGASGAKPEEDEAIVQAGLDAL
jgi:glc operon protein GlcG